MKRWFWIADTIVVVSFVVIGRDSHGFVSDVGADVRVAAPFLIALALGIVALRVWQDPLSLRNGFSVALITVIGGLLLRRYVFDRGTATTFVVLTSAWMIIWMVGWRFAAQHITTAMANRRSSRTA